MVAKKVLVSDSFLSSESGSPISLVWSGRLPEYEIISFLDDQELHHESVQSLICIVDKREHSRRRQPWTRSFSTSALKIYEGVVIKRTLQLVEALSKGLDEAVDLNIWIEFFRYAAVIVLMWE
jgi:cytochrome P450